MPPLLAGHHRRGAYVDGIERPNGVGNADPDGLGTNLGFDLEKAQRSQQGLSAGGKVRRVIIGHPTAVAAGG